MPVTLANVPDDVLDRLAGFNFDAVWLMGVWERSPAGIAIARAHADLQDEFHRALPDFSPADVIGSPYAVRRYVVDPHLGGTEGLAAFREALAARGIRLILDFVPNHLATDHPATHNIPEIFVQGTPEDLTRSPDAYFAVEVDGKRVIYAHGRDPYFPPWTDTVQLNTNSIRTRRHIVETLRRIAGQCDGVRCDMAMLNLNDVFTRTWGVPRHPDINDDFWDFTIPRMHQTHPGFLFIAEAYWDLEWTLQQQGFDYTYDKRLYDRIRAEDARRTLDHLHADIAYQSKLIRFIENHDGPRAAAVFAAGHESAAAVLICTVPGAHLLHHGQFEGWRARLPVQLGRYPDEPTHYTLPDFYSRLLDETAHPLYHDGTWSLLDVFPAWKANTTHTNLIAYTWTHNNERRLIVVNLMPTQSQGRIHLPWKDMDKNRWRLHDLLDGETYTRSGDNLALHGLYIDLPPHGYHLFRLRAGGSAT
jgi:glycosidase